MPTPPSPRFSFSLALAPPAPLTTLQTAAPQVVRLLGVAGHALLDSPGLIGLALGLQVVWVLALVAPLVVSGWWWQASGVLASALPRVFVM